MSSSQRQRTAALVGAVPLIAALFAAASASGADWPQFRGPHRDGISEDQHILKAWPETGPKVLWKVPLGEGYSHIAVAAGRLFTQYISGADELLACFDPATGRQLWSLRTDSKFVNDQGNGPRATPTVDGDRVYALSAQGHLYAVEAGTGKKLWEHDLAREQNAKGPSWGVASSPLVEGDLLFIQVGGAPAKTAMAFNKKTGELKWSALDDRPGYAAPIGITVGNVRQIVFFTGSALSALSPESGKLLWHVPWETDFDANAATPLFLAPDEVFISSGYDAGAALYRIRNGPEATAQVEQVWKSRVLKNQFSSSILRDGYIYGFDNATLKCITAQTGEEKWKQRGLGHGSVIFADGLLILLSDAGKLVLAEANPNGYTEKASFQALSGKCWTGPTLANGILFLRNSESMMAIDLSMTDTKGANP